MNLFASQWVGQNSQNKLDRCSLCRTIKLEGVAGKHCVRQQKVKVVRIPVIGATT